MILPANASVIEVGCGDGELLAMLKPKDRVGVDISRKQVALAHQNNPDLEFVQQAGEELQMEGIERVQMSVPTVLCRRDRDAPLPAPIHLRPTAKGQGVSLAQLP